MCVNLEVLRKVCEKSRFSRENLRSWYKFYTTVGRDGRDKSQLWFGHQIMMIIIANNLIIEIVIIITIILLFRGSLLNSCAMASGLGIALAYLVQRPQ